jgi:phosphoserine phosphatase
MNMLIREYGITKEDCVFVGDGENDADLAAEVGTSVCFNGAPRLQAVCTHSVRQKEGDEDLTTILQYIPF